MKKISIMILVLVVAMASCKKTPEVNLKYVDVERDLITVGTTTATVQCDYQYIATLKKAYFYYGEGEDEADMNAAEMRVVQNTLYVDLAGLKESTTYSYYYEFHNGFNSMRTVAKTFKTEGSGVTITLPTVVTAEVIEITTNSAKGGGEVTDDGGAEVTERGICWSTNENPTLNDNHIAKGTGTGAFIAMMSGLEANTTYHVRAYATNEVGTAYGLDREFVTDDGGGGCDCGYVDLGLPSGTLWSTCNVGANSPEEYGDYFAWGETEPKSVYEWSNYKYCNGDQYQLTKYCNNSLWGYNGFTDTLTFLQSMDDAATANWEDDWCTPSKEQWEELCDNTTSIWTTQNDVEGRLFIADNGNSIFLPAAHLDSPKDDSFKTGFYWSSLCTGTDNAFYLNFSSDYISGMLNGNLRKCGFSVRPVRKTNTPTPPEGVPEGAINGLFTINANGDQVYFSQGNLQYQASTNTWRFAEKQWNHVGGTDYITGDFDGNVEGSTNNAISSDYSGWIDLFKFGTSGYNHGAVCYQPWSTNSENVNYYAYGHWNYNLYDMNGQADWGYNPISNGGNQEHQWRTLTIQEWQYIFYIRNTISGIRYAKAKVNGVNGMILLPDGWAATVFPLTHTNESEAAYDSNDVSLAQWEELLEPNGAIFLPVTGYRTADSIVCWPRIEACYFSASFYNQDRVYFVYIYDSNLHVGEGEYQNYRYVAIAVRLVQDANL